MELGIIEFVCCRSLRSQHMGDDVVATRKTRSGCWGTKGGCVPGSNFGSMANWWTGVQARPALPSALSNVKLLENLAHERALAFDPTALCPGSNNCYDRP